jgi:tRNA(adenine34) deaminase
MTDDALIALALDQARLAATLGEVPIGAVLYHTPSERILAATHNRRILDRDPTAHAEILALRIAGEALGDWRLEECTLTVTLEPCVMCGGAIVNARVPRLVYGCDDPKAGAQLVSRVRRRAAQSPTRGGLRCASRRMRERSPRLFPRTASAGEEVTTRYTPDGSTLSTAR